MEVRDLLVANRVVRLVKKNPVELVFSNLGKQVDVVSWHDSSLYNSLGVEIDEADQDLIQDFATKRLLYSQKGCITGFARTADINRTDPVQVNWCGWKSKTNKRIMESSFGAETHGALLGYDMGHHLRALYVEFCHGPWALKEGDRLDWNTLTRLVLVTDCKSVFDCIRKSGHSIGDRGTAVNVAVLRQLCSFESNPPKEQATLLWVPTRHQCADGLTKSGSHTAFQSLLKEGLVTFHAMSAKSLLKTNRGSGQCES